MAGASKRRARSAGRRRVAASAVKSGRTPPAAASWLARVASRLDRTRVLLIAALVACATLPYLNILANGFVYDDDTQVLRNPYVHSFRYLKEIFTASVWSFSGIGPSNYYRPMMMLGYLLCYKVFGLHAYGFHLVSLALHAMIVCLVFFLTERLTQDRAWAFVAAAFFALHPIHSESVAWIAAVTDLELTFFYLLTFIFFLASARPVKPQTLDNKPTLPSARSPRLEDGPARPADWGCSKHMLAAMGATYLLTLLSKEQAMTLPVLATVYEHFFREDRSRTSFSQKLARYGLFWLLGLIYVAFRIRFLGGVAPAENMAQLTPKQILLSALALFGQYGWKLLWPVRLCAYYVFYPSNSPFEPRVLAGLLVLVASVGLFLVCWSSRERNVHFVCFAILWFFATLAPVLNAHFVASNVFTERYLYLPSVGVSWLVGLGVVKLWLHAGARPAAKRALALAGVTVAVLLATRIVTRDLDWNNDLVLYTQTLEISPDAQYIVNNLGIVYWEQGDLEKAESEWQHLLAMIPRHASALDNLGRVAIRRHQYPKAADFFRRAVETAPRQPEPHLHLGETYRDMGMMGLAEHEFREAVAVAPLDPSAHQDLGQFLFAQGHVQEAEEQFRASIRAYPNVSAYDYLGMVSMRRGDTGEAVRDFRAALELDESDSYAHFGLGDLYTLAGRKDEALIQYQAGLAKDPHNPMALAAIQRLRQQMAAPLP